MLDHPAERLAQAGEVLDAGRPGHIDGANRAQPEASNPAPRTAYGAAGGGVRPAHASAYTALHAEASDGPERRRDEAGSAQARYGSRSAAARRVDRPVTDPLDRDLFRRIQDRVAIVGIGHLPFAKDIGRPISDTAVEALHTPWGLIRPVDVVGMWAHRHMHEYGTRREHFGNVAIAARKHAQRNPHALMRGRPLDMATYLAARPIGYPLHLYDCCLESDGALACVVTSVERARDLRQKPALVHSVAQASGPNPVHLANYNNTPAMLTTSAFCAELLWARSELKPKDMACAQIYDAFTPLVVMGLEDYGFCKRGEGGPFTDGGRLELGGALPVLTSGGGLSEAYVHGFNLILEGVRQIRGTSSNQVPGCKATLVTGASGVATSALVLRGQ